MRKSIIYAVLLLAITTMLAGCSTSRKAVSSASTSDFPKIGLNGKVAIAAHRGFWKCEEAMSSQNSIASLRQAQVNGFWGSECDIHLTSDGKIIVNHDGDINGLKIAEHSFAELCEHNLANGEKRPSFDEYLEQAAKEPKTLLIVEFKKQPAQDQEEELVQKALKALKKHKLYSPERVAFISFSHYVCRRIAMIAPEFINQYLEGDMSPAQLAQEGINGIDYHFDVLYTHPDWVKQAHELGMSVNVWTVNNPMDMKAFIDMGVDAITTNEPLTLRALLENNENKR